MPSILIENFKFGLDKRRSILTSQMGTLDVIVNAHINQGGEIEKRKAFIPVNLATNRPAGLKILGVEALKDHVVIYGDIDNPEDSQWPPVGGSLPFVYQPLFRYPAAEADGKGETACNVTLHENYCSVCVESAYAGRVNAEEIIHSTVYGNKTFVIARLVDQSVVAFYDGKIIKDINNNGYAIPGMTSTQAFFCSMVDAFEGQGYYTADLIPNSPTGIHVTGMPGKKYTIDLETSSMCGGVDELPKADLQTEAVDPIPGKTASGYFSIEDGISDVGQILSVELSKYSADTSTETKIELLKIGADSKAAPITFKEDSITTARLVTAAINDAENTHAFMARNDGAMIMLYTDTNTDIYNSYVIKVTTDAKVVIAKCAIGFKGTGFTLNSIAVDGVDILPAGGYVYPLGTETVSAFVGRVAEGIRGRGVYAAISRDNVLKISKLITASNVESTPTDTAPKTIGMLDVLVTVTPNPDGVAYDADESFMSARIDASLIEVKFYYGRSFDSSPWGGSSLSYEVFGYGQTSDPVRAVVTGGVPPYKYNWRVEQAHEMAIVIDSPNQPSSHINDHDIPKTTSASQIRDNINDKSAYLFLDVTDSQDQKASSAGVSVKGRAISGQKP